MMARDDSAHIEAAMAKGTTADTVTAAQALIGAGLEAALEGVVREPGRRPEQVTGAVRQPTGRGAMTTHKPAMHRDHGFRLPAVLSTGIQLIPS
jgi:hypothetical protein